MVKGNSPKLIGKETIFIDENVVFGKNVVIYPGNIIYGKCVIGNNTTLKPQNYISDSIIGDECVIDHSYIENAVVGEKNSIGPFSRLRPQSKIGNNCKIGNFVEIKNSTLGDGSKASHLAYIGDSNIGKNCNIGCGAIFVNYDGTKKSRTRVGDDCFVGSNANIIAPVNISNHTYICAGTTVTNDTDSYDFVIGRVNANVKKGYAKKYFK